MTQESGGGLCCPRFLLFIKPYFKTTLSRLAELALCVAIASSVATFAFLCGGKGTHAKARRRKGLIVQAA